MLNRFNTVISIHLTPDHCLQKQRLLQINTERCCNYIPNLTSRLHHQTPSYNQELTHWSLDSICNVKCCTKNWNPFLWINHMFVGVNDFSKFITNTNLLWEKNHRITCHGGQKSGKVSCKTVITSSGWARANEQTTISCAPWCQNARNWKSGLWSPCRDALV